MSEANTTTSVARSDKASAWSVTINNPTADDLREWEQLKGYSWVREVKGQMERGENGTLHIQGFVKTQHIRFSQIKRALTRAHIEKARNEAALVNYVQKEETRVAAIPTAKIATQKDVQRRLMQMTLEKYLQGGRENTKEGFYSWLELETVKNKHFPEIWLDAAVKMLILDGYFGIEFVVSNPQVRTAFKKYFCEIIIREYGSSSQEHRDDGSTTHSEGVQSEAEE